MGVTVLSDLRPCEAHRIAADLAAKADRPARALRIIIRERGYGGNTELQNATGISGTTIRKWQDTTISSDQVYRLALAYAARADEVVTDPATVDPTVDEALAARVDELFDLFYSDNHRDAVIWLSTFKPHFFQWNTDLPVVKVA